MKLLLIRHGQPDYTEVGERGFVGHGRDLAKLSPLGISQAEAVSKDERLKDADVILSSPYTRALQTAAIISKNTGISIAVETDLIEWMPDLTFAYAGPEHFGEIEREIQRCRGERDDTCKYCWESYSSLGQRAFLTVKKYLEYDKVIVVTHGMLMRQFVYQDEVPCCSVMEYELRPDSRWNGFVK